jgi:hypothetical protein
MILKGMEQLSRPTEFTGNVALCIDIQRNKRGHGIWNSAVMTLRILWIDKRGRNARESLQELTVEVDLALPSDCLMLGEVTLIQTVCLIFKYKERRPSICPYLTREFRIFSEKTK